MTAEEGPKASRPTLLVGEKKWAGKRRNLKIIR